MSTDNTHQTLVKYLKKKPKVSFHPVFSLIAGSVNAGLMLSQLLYWSDGRGWHKDGWIWKTSDEWLRETSLTESEVEGARDKLIERGLIKYKRMGMPAIPHYLLQEEAILSAINALSLSFWSILIKMDNSEASNSANKIVEISETSLTENAKQDCQKKSNLPGNNLDTGSPISGKLHTEITPETTSEITSNTTTTTGDADKSSGSGGVNYDFINIDWPQSFLPEDRDGILIFAKVSNVSTETVQHVLDEFRAAQSNSSRNPITNHIQWVESVMRRGVKRTTAGRAYSENRRNSTIVKCDAAKLPLQITKPRDIEIFKRAIVSQKALCKQGELRVKYKLGYP